VWDKVRKVSELVGLPTRLLGWWEALSGIYDPLGQPSTTGFYAQHNPTVDPTKIDETPWEILRLSLIWFLWYQKCEFDLRRGDFHVGIALSRAWQTIVQAGMGAWQELTKFNGEETSEKQKQKEESFIRTWSHGGIFCKTERGISWQIVPHRDFLTRNLANRYKSFRAGIHQLAAPPNTPTANLPTIGVDYNTTPDFSQLYFSSQRTESLAEEVIYSAMAQILPTTPAPNDTQQGQHRSGEHTLSLPSGASGILDW
jgi:hypothetical protein